MHSVMYRVRARGFSMLRLLLVVGFMCYAQARNVVTSQQPLGDATNALQAARQILEDALRTPPSPAALTSVSSVVQDWSLVCKELCGARLVLAPCADYCATPGLEAATILGTVFDLVKCDQLQGTQSEATCNEVESIKLNGGRLCSSFCRQRRRTLSGCSPCQLLGVFDEFRVVSAEQQSAATHGSGAGKPAEEQEREREQGLTLQGRSAAMDTATVTDTDTDTPDWNEVCKSLCKTGDGGSLCNCDLSPFFS